VSAFLGISIALFFGKGYESADDWAALFGSAFIFYNSYLYSGLLWVRSWTSMYMMIPLN
jgi:hypothetical protein